MREIKVGLVGFGAGGEFFHAPIISSVPGFKLTHVVERHKERSKELYPSVRVLKNIDDLLRSPEVSLVVITTPNWMHFEQAQKAIEAGKNVIVDKPFTVTSKEADSLIELAKSKNLLLSVYQNRRWDGAFLTIKKIIEGNWLGDITGFDARFDRYRPEPKQDSWRENARQGGGLFYDLGPHLIDQAVQLFGLPLAVRAEIKVERKNCAADDYFDVNLKYDKVKVRLKAGMLVKEATPNYVLQGTEGSFTKYGFDSQEVALKAGELPKNNRSWGWETADKWGFSNSTAHGLKYYGKVETVPGDYRKFYENIYQVMTGEEELAVKPEQAREVIRIIELARLSSKEKKEILYSH